MRLYIIVNILLISVSGFFFSTKPLGYNELNDKISVADYVPTNDDIKQCILNNWWDLAKKIVEKSHEKNVDLSKVVYSTIESVQKDSRDLIKFLNSKDNELDTVDAALQWAESPYEVFLNVKFSSRWSSPGAIHIENEKLNVEDDTLEFSGIGEHYGKRKKYQVKLQLYQSVIGSQTKTTPSSTGRFTIILKKTVPSVWKQLVKPTSKCNNIHIWLDMKDKYKEECDKFLEGNDL